MIPFSVLDLAPIVEGGDASQSFRNSLDLAQHAERWGYRRYWLAEHHNMPGIASAATSILIGHVAGGTSTIRVGAGGIMLPNHAPLQIAEQFGTLEALFPGRIDLGLGRAPGGDHAVAHALRRTLVGGPDRFPQDVVELQSYFEPVQPGQRVQAVPGAGMRVPLWILGSSLFGAQLAAALGLPYAFASHFAPGAMMQAIDVYRRGFQPSDQLKRALRHAGLQRDRRRDRRGGAAPLDLAPAGVPQPSPRQPQATAAAGRPGRDVTPGGGDAAARPCRAPRSARPTPCGASWRRSSSAPGPTS